MRSQVENCQKKKRLTLGTKKTSAQRVAMPCRGGSEVKKEGVKGGNCNSRRHVLRVTMSAVCNMETGGPLGFLLFLTLVHDISKAGFTGHAR